MAMAMTEREQPDDVILVLRCEAGHYLPWFDALRPYPDECTTRVRGAVCGLKLTDDSQRFRPVTG